MPEVINEPLVAPFVIYAGAAIAIFAVLRPFLHLVAFDRAFSWGKAGASTLMLDISGQHWRVGNVPNSSTSWRSRQRNWGAPRVQQPGHWPSAPKQSWHARTRRLRAN